jgi:hypothetical protein
MPTPTYIKVDGHLYQLATAEAPQLNDLEAEIVAKIQMNGPMPRDLYERMINKLLDRGLLVENEHGLLDVGPEAQGAEVAHRKERGRF